MSENEKMLQQNRTGWGYLFLILFIIALPVAAGAETHFVLNTAMVAPYIINYPGTFVLDDVIYDGGPVFASTSVVILIQSDDVVLDGNGFTIVGDNGVGDYGVWVPAVGPFSPYDGVHVKNIHVQSFDRGIFFNSVTDGRIENVEADLNSGSGIRLDFCTNIDVDNSYLHNNNDGLYLDVCTNIDVYENQVTGNSNTGIYSQFGGNHLIHENDVNNNWVGIFLTGDTGSTIGMNEVFNSGVDGITYDLGTGGVINQNTVNGNFWSGILIRRSQATTVTNNILNQNGNWNIRLAGSPPLPVPPGTGNLVADNSIIGKGVGGNDVGVLLIPFTPPPGPPYDPSHDNTISNNTITNIQTGIRLDGCGDTPADGNNVIIDNTITTVNKGIVLAPSSGVPIHNSNFNQIINNTVEYAASEGIRLEGIGPANRINNNVLDGNQIQHNKYGIFIEYAQVNTLLNNTIIDNSVEGLTLKGSTLNLIYNNCFNNTVNVGWGGVLPWANKWETLVSPGPNIVGGKYLGGNYWAWPSGNGPSQTGTPNADEFLTQQVGLDGGVNIDYHPLWNPLSASFTANPTSGPAPLTVDFTDTSYGYPTCWHWDFGDSETSDEQNPTHTYDANGDYQVTLTVWRCAVDGCAAGDTFSSDIAVGTLAEFNATPTVGPVPLMVTFTDLSIGATSWEWKYKKTSDLTWTPFTQQYEPDPIQVFTSSGLYDIWLHVEGSAPDDEIKTAYIDARVPLPCDSDFVGAPLYGPIPLMVQFTDLSTNNPAAWTWEYRYPSGSGSWNTFSTLQNPDISFTTPGAWDIRLTATNEGGGMIEEKTGYIYVEGPQADFVASPRSGTTALTVYFTDLSTNSPSSWKWYYRTGGGPWNQFAVTQDPSYTFSDVGTYDIKLIVDDGQPWADPEEKLGYITVSQIPAPEADFSGSPRTGIKPLTVDFADLSANNPMSWTWQYKLTTSGTWTTFSSQQHPIFEFPTPGIYDVRLTATNDGGSNTNTKSGYITVNNIPAPDVDFTASPRSGIKPLTVDFTDLSANNPTSWAWDFTNDGVVDNTTQHPTYTYTAVGTYSVRLMATNDGGSSTFIKNSYITVSNIPAPTANFTAVPLSGIKQLTVNFIDQSTGAPTTWAWDFNNDGVVDSTEKNPVYTYNSPGTYTVKLNVSNAGGYNVNTMVNYIVVNDIPLPVADFTATPLSAITPVNVAFTDTSTGGVTSWLWDFGDGTTSTLQSPTHTYTTPRKYTVSLTVSNAKGVNAKIEPDFIYVRNTPPVAAFDASPRSGDAPLTVQFSDQSAGLGITSWLWNFGDGSTSTTQNPLYVYNTAGTYTVTLTVANDGGSDAEVKNAYITVNPAQQANLIKLYPGWNFVSVPKKLASGQNTAIQVFGGVDLGGRAILLWDASTGSWKQVMAGDIVRPLNGYWVYSVTRIDVPLTFDTSTPPAPTSKELYAGWNAIGYAGTTSMSARNFLTLGGGLNGNWIQLLGFHEGINPDIPIIRDSNDGLPMYPTKGYWIAMSTNDTLTVVV